MKFHKKIITVLAVAGLSIGLSACGGSSDTGAGKAGEKITLTYLSWNSEKEVRPLIDAFEKANPNIKIDVQTAEGSANGYAKTLTTRASGNQLPDIFHMSTELRDVMKNGWAKDLTKEPFMEGIDQTAKDLYSYNGKVYGMAVSAWGGVIVYNKALLKKAGVSEEIPTKLPEFIEYGKKIKAAGIIPYMEESNVVSGSFLPMLNGWYATHKISDKENPIWEGKKTFTEIWTPLIKQWQTLSSSGVMPKEVVGLSYDQMKQEFVQGKVAMFRSGPWEFQTFHDAKIDFGTAPYPAFEGGEPYIGGGPDSPFCLSAKLEGDRLKAAQTFMSFVNSPEGLKVASEKMGKISSSSKYQTKVDPAFEKVYVDYLRKGKYGWANWPKNGNNMAKVMSDNFQKIILGQATPEEVAKALDEAWKQ